MLPGDIVKITEGPLVGKIARLAGVADGRASICLQLDGRDIDIELDLDWIAPAAPERKSASGTGATGAQRWSSA